MAHLVESCKTPAADPPCISSGCRVEYENNVAFNFTPVKGQRSNSIYQFVGWLWGMDFLLTNIWCIREIFHQCHLFVKLHIRWWASIYRMFQSVSQSQAWQLWSVLLWWSANASSRTRLATLLWWPKRRNINNKWAPMISSSHWSVCLQSGENRQYGKHRNFASQ